MSSAMLTFVLISALFAAPAPDAGPYAPPREGHEAALPPKGVIPSDPARQRLIFAGKVETAWLLADGVPDRSEPEACP